MASGVILAKFEELADRVVRVERHAPEQYADFKRDRDAQDLVEVNFCHAIQLCVDIATHLIAQAEAEVPNSMAATFDTICKMGAIPNGIARTMKDFVHIRNVATHRYTTLELKELYSASTDYLDTYRTFGREIDRYLHTWDNPSAPSGGR